MLHGIVTTFDSIPLIGANVKIKSTKQNILTDSMGNFLVRYNHEDKLKVTANGFYSQNVKLTGNIKIAAINLKLKPGKKNREYAVGYGFVSDIERINAVASFNQDDVDFSMYSNMYDLIRGRVAGVQIVNDVIVIRGINSINSNGAALVIIDGIQMDPSILAKISPMQVKSINVIKDGSAAIYGSQGSNGVLIIETKRWYGY